MIKLFRIRITGLVQGVSFRFYAQNKAKDLGLAGFIRNASDGSLTAEAEGKEDDLKAFVNWCSRGPSGAKVSHVEMEVLPPKGHKGFEIRK